MLSELCKEINNWFQYEYHFGKFKIEGGKLTDFDSILKDGQYFRIVGSVLNDGVYEWPASDLKDEEFDGAVWLMAVPPEVIKLALDVDEWRNKYETLDNQAMSPFTSENFGGYSYAKSGAGSAGGASASGWTSVFANRLNRWRKIRP